MGHLKLARYISEATGTGIHVGMNKLLMNKRCSSIILAMLRLFMVRLLVIEVAFRVVFMHRLLVSLLMGIILLMLRLLTLLSVSFSALFAVVCIHIFLNFILALKSTP